MLYKFKLFEINESNLVCKLINLWPEIGISENKILLFLKNDIALNVKLLFESDKTIGLKSNGAQSYLIKQIPGRKLPPRSVNINIKHPCKTRGLSGGLSTQDKHCDVNPPVIV